MESFKSTLDEVRESDLLIHVVDLAHPQYEDHIQTVTQTLNELNAGEKELFLVFNKLDAYRDNYFDERLEDETRLEIEAELRQSLISQYGEEIALVSAHTGEGIAELRERLAIRIREIYRIRYPYQEKQW